MKCTVDGCEHQVRTIRSGLCDKHATRRYRHGDVNAYAYAVKTRDRRRYRELYRPGHPLASPAGRVYAHRVALYEALGEGMHPCHFCGVGLDWHMSPHHPQRLTVDHLNGEHDDNRPENLVAACRKCNTGRGNQVRADALRDLGFWSGRAAERLPRITARDGAA